MTVVTMPTRTMFGHFIEDVQLTFDVLAHPAPQGSKRHVGHGVMVEVSKYLQPWRKAVDTAAREAIEKANAADADEAARAAMANAEDVLDTEGPYVPKFPLQGPCVLTATFFIDRPLSHYRSGPYKHMLRDNAPPYPARRPDLDKLLRSTMDAMTTAGVWRDDGLVHIIHARKHWSTYRALWYAAGVRVVVSTPQ